MMLAGGNRFLSRECLEPVHDAVSDRCSVVVGEIFSDSDKRVLFIFFVLFGGVDGVPIDTVLCTTLSVRIVRNCGKCVYYFVH